MNWSPLPIAALSLAAMVAFAVVAIGQSAGEPRAKENPAAASCEAKLWPETVVSCADAHPDSLGMTTVSETRIWLTTLAAVDASLHPRRQVADHPADPFASVWVFVFDGRQPGILHADEFGSLVTSKPEHRMLYVTYATNPAARNGAFVYIYGWSELGSPELATTMPAVAEPRDEIPATSNSRGVRFAIRPA